MIMIVAVPDVEEVAPRQYQGFHWKILLTNLVSVGNMYNSHSPISIFRPIIQSKAFWTWKYTVEDCFMCCGLEWYPIHSLDTFRLLACSCVWGTEGYIWAKLLGLASYSQLIFIGSLCPRGLSFVFGCLSVYWWCCVDFIHVSQVLP